MDQSSNQRKAGRTTGDKGSARKTTPKKSKGRTVVLPFTLQELTEEYMNLKSADEREIFWKDLAPFIDALDEEQRALFAISCSRSLDESNARLDLIYADVDQAVK